jgi:hypothetical protein
MAARMTDGNTSLLICQHTYGGVIMYSSTKEGGHGSAKKIAKGEDIRLYKEVEGSGQEQRRSGTTKPARGRRGTSYQQ